MKRKIQYISVPFIIISISLFFYFSGGRYITSENAYVKNGILMIAPDASGKVNELFVKQNQYVEAGTLLLTIDNELELARIAKAEASIVARKSLVKFHHAKYRKDLATIAEKKEELAYEERELVRFNKLIKTNNTTTATLNKHEHLVAAAKAEIITLKEAAAETLTLLGGHPKLDPVLHPMVKELQADLDAAKILLSHKKLYADTAGTITKIDIHLGTYVAQGKPIFGMSVDKTPWIEANLKETYLHRLRIGQKVHIKIDGYPNHNFEGSVESINPAAGAEFALLPPQNATGNWIKVTRRIPVQIAFKKSTMLKKLRAGMSVEVKIDTGNKRTLTTLLNDMASIF